jgi:phage shock protein C
MSTFTLDKTNGKIMGVCSGLARSTGIDITLIRIGAVLVTLAVSGLTIPAYLIAGLVAPQR